jgi:sigma54-dependent transcription regulator
MSHLERALDELEHATAALAGIPIDDLAEAQAALDRRSRAITTLAGLTGAAFTGSQEEREDTLRRLRLSCEAGSEAQQRLAAVTRAALAEWRQWSQIYRSLGGKAVDGENPVVGCRLSVVG